MAARNLVVENFDQFVDSALNELGNRYQHNECSGEEEENLRKGAIELLGSRHFLRGNILRMLNSQYLPYTIKTFACSFAACSSYNNKIFSCTSYMKRILIAKLLS